MGMGSPESHPIEKLNQLADAADTALKHASASGSFRESDKTLDALEAELKAAERMLNPFEEQLHLAKQYEAQIALLDRLGIPETLLGTPRPTLEQVRDRLLAKQELCAQKIEQGFRKLLLVPFGMSISDLAKLYEDELKEHNVKGMLFAEADPATPLALDTNQPVLVWDGYKNEEMRYFPDQFDQANPSGFSKQEVLDRDGPWQVVLVEDTPIPRVGNGQVLLGRKQLEAGESPGAYLAKLKTDPQYAGEEGLTPELWLMKALTRLAEQNQVIDDHGGKGSLSYNLGAYFPKSAFVANACWYRDLARASMGRNDADHAVSGNGASSAVRV
jgi:hypothetical protein